MVRADGDAMLLVMRAEPIDGPVTGYGLFVMNSWEEIREAIVDVNAGRFGTLTSA